MKLLALLCGVLALAFVGNKLLGQVAASNDLAKFGIALVLGFVAAILGIHFVLPRVGEAIVRFLFSWNDPPDNEQPQAMNHINALKARGDYKGAIAACESLLASEPSNIFVIAEMAKIYAERLDDCERGIAVLTERLASRTWAMDDDAYLRFRQIDLYQQADHREAAERALERIIADYPDTKHSGNAHHRLHELRPKQTPTMKQGW